MGYFEWLFYDKAGVMIALNRRKSSALIKKRMYITSIAMQRASTFTALSFAVTCTCFALAARADNSGEKSAIEKLNEKAQIICTGIPLEVVITDQKSKLVCPWSSGSPFPVRAVIAKVKVLGTTKGKVGPEIEIRYRDYDFEKMKNITVTGILPALIRLSVGKRYRFYLNPVSGQAWYVSAMKDETQSGFAVQELGANEKDSDPPLLTDEAVQIATNYLRQKQPSFKLNPKWIIAEFEGQHWTVEFFEHEFLSYPAFTYGAEIVVDSDRSIDSDSWIAIDTHPAGRRELVGRYVRILYQPPQDGGVYIIRGYVERVANGQISLRMSKADIHFQPGYPNHLVDEMEIPPSQMKGVSVLLE